MVTGVSQNSQLLKKVHTSSHLSFQQIQKVLMHIHAFSMKMHKYASDV